MFEVSGSPHSEQNPDGSVGWLFSLCVQEGFVIPDAEEQEEF